MDFHLDQLLNFPNITIEKCIVQDNEVHLGLRLLNDAVSCQFCCTKTDTVNQRRPLEVRDLSILGKFTVLEIKRRQFKCENCQKYFTEALDFIDFDHHSTLRYQAYIYERVKAENITQVAREEALTYDRVKSLFELQFARLKKTDDSEASQS